MIATFWRRYRTSRMLRFIVGSIAVGALLLLFNLVWNELGEKRISVVIPHRVIRGAWQRPTPLLSILRREGIRTVMTLTAINRDDPKYVDQARVAHEQGVTWLIIPMRGSSATPEQMALAADLATDPLRQPVFFHCVAGHHRSNLVQAAIRIRHQNWSVEDAWKELVGLPWTRPDFSSDLEDRALIEQFSRIQGSIPRALPEQVRELTHAVSRQTRGEVDLSRIDAGRAPAAPLDRLD